MESSDDMQNLDWRVDAITNLVKKINEEREQEWKARMSGASFPKDHRLEVEMQDCGLLLTTQRTIREQVFSAAQLAPMASSTETRKPSASVKGKQGKPVTGGYTGCEIL